MEKKYDLVAQIMLGTVIKENTLLISPNKQEIGNIIKIVSSYFLSSFPEKKVIIALSENSLYEKYSSFLDGETLSSKYIIIRSKENEEERRKKYSNYPVIIASSKLLHNDIYRGFLSPDECSLIILDDAKVAKGRHAHVMLLKIFRQNNLKVRIFALTRNFFSSTEELEQVLTNLLITKIEYRKSSTQNFTKEEKIITVPLNKELYEFIFELNRIIDEYRTFLENEGIEYPLTVRREFSKFLARVKSEYSKDSQEVIIRKTIELINFLTLKETIESLGIKAGISFLENLQKKDEDKDMKQTFVRLKYKFSRTPVFFELLEELQRLAERVSHPKFKRLNQLVETLNKKSVYSKFLVVCPNSFVLKEIHRLLENKGIPVVNIFE
ncbi:MAG: hypothetical protein ACTSSF_13325, partial [Candidatus Heimdallarchaeaceae archaeon]